MSVLTNFSTAGEEHGQKPGRPFHQTAFSVPQVAARWGVSSRHIYDLCARSELGPVVNSRRRDQRVSYRRVGAELVHFRGMG
jgi:hypothetical protein